MSNISIDPAYDLCRTFIERWRQRGKSWEELPSLGKTPEDLNNWFLEQEELQGWPSLGSSPEERALRWREIINAKQLAEQRSLVATRPLVVVGAEEAEPDVQVPSDPHSAWQLYRAHLHKQDWNETSVQNIETAALRVLRYLRTDTSSRGPVKGLVVGHVQSGKTANMAGLISMAADHRWNLFVVLTGTLENLRIQTRERLIKDLFLPGNLNWKSIDHPSKDSPYGNRAENMQFEPGRPDRHMIVCLKNPSRLKHLIEWIEAHKVAMKQMRLVIIDDEADQAGINTGQVSKEERSKINKLILRLVNLPLQSVNYVAYTATPAANFLNEGPGKTLYPEDFIVALEQSNEHFGPVQIFGHLEAGRDPLGIVLDVPKDDLGKIDELHHGKKTELPATLERSLLWFLCCVATIRVSGARKPVSMLVHTSSKQLHHTNMERAVRGFLDICAQTCNVDEARFRSECSLLWNSVTSDLDRLDFSERFRGYGRLDTINELPDFNTIFPEIKALLLKITAIELDDQQERTYHKGIHICVDNCANNGINDENEVRRLFYPDASDQLDFASAFIVIGGGTLSRGLTIENLVSTFFLRASAQADSLMQMGRWFGYRRGYELLPRIWMPCETRERYEFMTIAEEDLRDDLERFMHGGSRPSEFGPRVRVHPRMAWLRPTAPNKMQKTVTADFDFSGINRQTTLFHDGDHAEKILNKNRLLTEAFLRDRNKDGERGNGNSLVWRNVPVAEVAGFLSSFEFHSGNQFFSDITPFLKWLEQHEADAGYNYWNVVVAGNSGKKRSWELPGGVIGLVNRSRIVTARSDDGVSIGALRDPRDLLADAKLPDGFKASDSNFDNGEIDRMRASGGVGGIPQLLFYLIDSVSEYSRDVSSLKSNSRRRDSLNAASDIVGVSLWLPGGEKKKRTYATHLTVKIPPSLVSTEDDLDDTGAEV
ncbi:Z1 domain-containing protein [Pseudomonas sp. PCH199]|uniref:Z1 domain-containing protein n=1 Tax=unclassified Pseudomonas TaxID=196821 RepID=UPI000BCAB227|nr:MULTISPECIES: Z1 domain-containing protein [unclassified Pseudomonas]MCW8275517.1 Z1 domain-containing protein [Pseudomonas sp. PCH199]PAM84391.1 endonuclease [Pseudomonas sp. ERMR1:02]